MYREDDGSVSEQFNTKVFKIRKRLNQNNMQTAADCFARAWVFQYLDGQKFVYYSSQQGKKRIFNSNKFTVNIFYVV